MSESSVQYSRSPGKSDISHGNFFNVRVTQYAFYFVMILISFKNQLQIVITTLILKPILNTTHKSERQVLMQYMKAANRGPQHEEM